MAKDQAAVVPELSRSVTHWLHRATQVADTYFDQAVTRVTHRQFAVLAALEAAPNQSQTDLVRCVGIDRSTLAAIVKRLIKSGLVTRRRTKRDARAYEVRLTDQGLAALAACRIDAAGSEQKFLSVLSAEDRDRLITLLRKLVSAEPGWPFRASANREHDLHAD